MYRDMLTRSGALMSSGITYGTARLASTWAWRIPSALQGFFSIIAIIILFVVPESPRWLARQERTEEALEVVALFQADGDATHPDTLLAWQEIMDGIEFDKAEGRQATFKQVVRTPDMRMRLVLVASASVCAMLSGNNIVSFYLGDMLTQAGIPDSNTQMEIVRPHSQPSSRLHPNEMCFSSRNRLSF